MPCVGHTANGALTAIQQTNRRSSGARSAPPLVHLRSEVSINRLSSGARGAPPPVHLARPRDEPTVDFFRVFSLQMRSWKLERVRYFGKCMHYSGFTWYRQGRVAWAPQKGAHKTSCSRVSRLVQDVERLKLILYSPFRPASLRTAAVQNANLMRSQAPAAQRQSARWGVARAPPPPRARPHRQAIRQYPFRSICHAVPTL